MAFWKIKNKNKHKNPPKIFPLSPNSELDNDQLSGFDVYKNHLTAVLKDSRIHNIVLTGNFGIGKSSIIRSIEKDHCKKSRGFLYISLGNYINPNSNKEITDKKRKTKKNKQYAQNIVKQQNSLERRLLLQIYSRFRRKELPASSFKLIQEHGFLSKIGAPFWCAFSALVVFLLCCFDTISNLVSEGITQIRIWQLQNTNMSADEQANELLHLMETIKHCELWMQILLYLIIAIIIVSSVGFAVSRSIPKLNIKALNFKMDTIEAVCENNACESYLDQYATELVYCLEKIATKICYTVVIEDLDRLNEKTCLDIFTRLREINQLINIRLAKKKRNKHMRFIYVANDGMLSHLNCSKFADYIMPVFPRLNEKTAENILKTSFHQIINNINIALNIELKDDSFNDIIHIIAPCLKDYRLQYAVLNEFSLLFRIYCESNKNNPAIDSVATNVLAMVFYKNLFPNDYNKISTGESSVFPIYKSADFSNEKERSLLDALTNSSNPLLNCGCLYYAGYSRENVVTLYSEQLVANLAETLEFIKQENSTEGYEAVCVYCDKLTHAIASPDEPIECYESARLVINYLLECDSNYWDWLFNKKIRALYVLEILSANIYTDEKIITLFELAGLDIESDESLFDRCKGKNDSFATITGTNSLSGVRDLSEREYSVLRLGLGRNYNSNFTVRANGTPRALRRDLP